MKIALLSDIHGNLEALRRVLEDAATQAPDRMICLGDAIGYGPEPDQVVRVLTRKGIPTLLGNHELATIRPEIRDWFNPSARRSLERTLELLSPQVLELLHTWPQVLERDNALFVHGCPPDSITRYLFEVSDEDFPHLFETYPHRLCFVGHTHVLRWISWDGTDLERGVPGPQPLKLLPERRYIVNVGSVGQPRDGDNRAKYVLWDTESDTIQVRCVPYDIAATAEKILALGFPRINADRLW
ncbi:Predicted phosphodiesterase [Desulfacinum hydrothermale DSM 13146]|uniref:Predicted phosphodiesterase n=1 Tax=Desulfacinum hydrothermale DSM 13146 TaxID=1121390 RepID=A0A1W1XD55_9BACT|nr:metallophosphoesterase family protein [Desulfacinum hydrothermale]SMC21734.1 Predicted phosphodiesterase [Desulfacinum hydrothermale DSM 13146]